MDSLNPKWLSIELDSIDLTIQSWSDAARELYRAAMQSFMAAKNEIKAPKTPLPAELN